jgi:DNA/RNA-binding domain of Phe-tRNA-synthetase-like protein
MRKADTGESFLGIGMNKPLTFEGDEVVIEDEEKLVAIYPYRDAESSKITRSTKNVLIMVCGVPGVSINQLSKSCKVAVDYITKFCGGETTR